MGVDARPRPRITTKDSDVNVERFLDRQQTPQFRGAAVTDHRSLATRERCGARSRRERRRGRASEIDTVMEALPTTDLEPSLYDPRAHTQLESWARVITFS